MLELVGLHKSFGQAGVFGVDLQIMQGQIVALLGASGSGKTTLLNLIAGLTTPDAGAVWLGGQNLTHAPPEKRQLGYVFQDMALWPHLSALDHLLLVMKPANKAEALRLLKIVGLEGLETRKPPQLSGGQKQRVSLARALAAKPRLLLLDEPYSALDPVLREELRLEVAGLLRSEGITALHVTHDPDEALSIADQVAVMEAGRLVQLDSPHAVYQNPASLAAAKAFGRLNVMKVQVQNARLDLGSQLWPVEGLHHGAALAVVRYESLQEHPEGASAVVLSTYIARGETLAKVRLGPHELVVRTHQAVGQQLKLRPQQPIKVFAP